MEKLAERTRPYKVICDNCYRIIAAYKDEDGKIRCQCPDCGTRLITRRVTRDHYIKDIRSPRKK